MIGSSSGVIGSYDSFGDRFVGVITAGVSTARSSPSKGGSIGSRFVTLWASLWASSSNKYELFTSFASFIL